MTGPWKPCKTKQRFYTLSTAPWKSPTTRFPHSHSFGFASLEKWKTTSRFSTFPPPLATTTPFCFLFFLKPRLTSLADTTALHSLSGGPN